MQDKIKSLLEVDISTNQIKDIHCLGSQKNCPVKIELISNLTKRNLLANCQKLKGTKISIANDLTVQQREEQASSFEEISAPEQAGRPDNVHKKKQVGDKRKRIFSGTTSPSRTRSIR
ncbi:hypothetical protein JTB14_004596 [Gonioctena quinquepunctata]|nr:hypothetical protein JTB14_004596 [Gonioctena quinquepunctata]